MKLYSFQRMHVWDNLNQLGYYHPYNLYEYDSFLKEDLQYPWGFSQSYEWLKKSMKQKAIESIACDSHLIWAWYQWGGLKKKAPDKRYDCVRDYFKNEPYVMLELEIEPHRVLLSDYDLWHDVLNYHFIGKSRESDKMAKIHDYYKYKGHKMSYEGNALIEHSWEQIFDLKKACQLLQITQKKQRIQATFFELFFTDIQKVHFFQNKKCIETRIIHHS